VNRMTRMERDLWLEAVGLLVMVNPWDNTQAEWEFYDEWYADLNCH